MMKVVRIDKVSREAYVNPLFTGPEVTRQVLLPDSQENVVNVVHFGKGVGGFIFYLADKPGGSLNISS